MDEYTYLHLLYIVLEKPGKTYLSFHNVFMFMIYTKNTNNYFFWISVASWCSVCFCAVLCVCFCTGHFDCVPLNLICLYCLQHSFFEHHFNVYYSLGCIKNHHQRHRNWNGKRVFFLTSWNNSYVSGFKVIAYDDRNFSHSGVHMLAFTYVMWWNNYAVHDKQINAIS